MEFTLKNEKRASLLRKLEDRVEQKILDRGYFANIEVMNWVILFCFMALFFGLGYLLRWLDPLAAIMDGGVMMLLLLGALAVMIAHIWAVWATRTVLRELLTASRELFGESIKQFTSWQIILTYGATYFLLFWSFLMCFSKWL